MIEPEELNGFLDVTGELVKIFLVAILLIDLTQRWIQLAKSD